MSYTIHEIIGKQATTGRSCLIGYRAVDEHGAEITRANDFDQCIWQAQVQLQSKGARNAGY